MKVLLIGGSSDLGRELGKCLPFDFTNFDIKNDNPFVEKFILGSLINPSNLEFLKSCSFDAIVHISGIHPIMSSSSNLELMKSVNVDGVKNVLENITNHVNFIYISSSAAAKDSDYGKTKAQGEELVKNYFKDKPYGGFALRTKGFTPYFSPSYKSFVDYANWVLTGAVHIEDVVEAVRLCLQKPKQDFEMFVVDGKQDFTEEEQSTWSEDVLKEKYPQAKEFISTLTIPSKSPSYSDSKNMVGYVPSHGFSKVVEEFLKK